MPRRPRIKLAGIPQHLVQRGVNREPCFFAEEDCHCFLHWLQEAADDWRCVVYAYALMTNHVHLIVTPGTAEGPARLMQSLGRRYVQYINRHYKRSGNLWEGRYKSSAVQTEDYLLVCQRYIELNPVRADMVADPGQYRWSSYRRLALGQPDRLVTPHPLYLALGGTKPAARPPTAHSSAASSTQRRSPTSASPSHKASHSATTDSKKPSAPPRVCDARRPGGGDR